MSVDVLPPELMMRHGDPTLVRDELLHVIKTRIRAHPRSAQTRIGPSEIGTPCQRRLGYRLANVRTVNGGDGAAWRPTVGTAVHSWLESCFDADNVSMGSEVDGSRWLTEEQVNVGEIAGVPITGRVDLYDRITAMSIDWKCVGITTLRASRGGVIDPKYRVQGHLYGRGWARAGLPIDSVAIFYLPNNGELDQSYFWSESYDETIATSALDAANAVAAILHNFGPHKALPVLSTADDHCTFCPWFMPAASQLDEACPGHAPPKLAKRAAAQPGQTIAV